MLTQGVTTEIVNADGAGPLDINRQLTTAIERGLAINVGANIGFNSVVDASRRSHRSACDRGRHRPQMRRLIADGLAAGAWGVSAGSRLQARLLRADRRSDQGRRGREAVADLLFEPRPRHAGIRIQLPRRHGGNDRHRRARRRGAGHHPHEGRRPRAGAGGRHPRADEAGHGARHVIRRPTSIRISPGRRRWRRSSFPAGRRTAAATRC